MVRATGGQSQFASLVTAGVALATMWLLAPIFSLLPNATLAAVVIVYSIGLIDPQEFRAIRRIRTMEFRWAVIACLGVLLLGTLQGIVVAIIISLLGLASQTAHPAVYVIARKPGADVLRPLSPEHPDDEQIPGLLLLRPEGRLFFVNAQYVAEQIRSLVKAHQPKVLALDLSRVPNSGWWGSIPRCWRRCVTVVWRSRWARRGCSMCWVPCWAPCRPVWPWPPCGCWRRSLVCYPTPRWRLW